MRRGVYNVGDVMRDALREQIERGLPAERLLATYSLLPKRYILATIHRAENTDDPVRLHSILAGLAEVGEPVLLPLHPRTRMAMRQYGIAPDGGQIRFAEPLSFSEMIAAELNARVVVTDSGGVQKEASWVGVPCVTVREETEWVETIESGWNVLVGTDSRAIAQAVLAAQMPACGDGSSDVSASEAITTILEEQFS